MIFLFKNVRTVIKVEKILVEEGLNVVIRPVPTNVSSECGMCVQVSDEDSANACKLLNSNDILFQQIEIVK
jgi:hypothetical protein